MNDPRMPLQKAYDQDGRMVFVRVFVPSGFFARMRGLLGRSPLDVREAWWFRQCTCVHTFGMAFPIDVVHLSDVGVILRISQGLGPMRFSVCRGACQVIELRNGAAAAIGLKAGSRLELRQ